MSIIELVKKEMREKAAMEEKMQELCAHITERTSIVIPQSQTRMAQPYTIPHGTVVPGVPPRRHRKGNYAVPLPGIKERFGFYYGQSGF